MSAAADSGDLEALAARALDAATSAGASDAEAYVEESSGVEIKVYEDEVESLAESAQRGAGVRAWIDGRTGYAYGTELSDEGLREIAAGAAEAARIADPDEFSGPPEAGAASPEPISGLYDASLAQWDTSLKIALAREIERCCRALDPRVAAIEETVYADSTERVAIASSTGAAGAYEATSSYAYLRAIAGGDGEDRETGLGFGVARAPASLDPQAIGGEAADRAASVPGATKPGSGSCPVVPEEPVAAPFRGVLVTLP